MVASDVEPYKGGTYYLWHYNPSVPAAALFAAIFGILLVGSLWRLFKTRTWYCIPFVIGIIFELVGYIGRIISHGRTGQLNPYIVQSVTLLLAPALFAASIYMVLARIIRCVDGAALSVLPLRWITTIFVAGDVLSFLMQASGAGLLVQASSAKMGNNIIIGGLVLQVVIFGFFAITAGIFNIRIRRRPTQESFRTGVKWQQYLYMLYATSALILIRSIFRVIEYIEGQDGYLLSHEWTLYVFDAVPMMAVVVIFLVVYPAGIAAKRQRDVELAGVESGSDLSKASH